MVELFGTDLFGEPITQSMNGRLSELFLVSPFSVLNSRDGWWQERKRAWLSLGIESELGRKDNLMLASFAQENIGDKYDGLTTFEGSSIFDPVLCETIYRWFSPLGGQIIDPFSGGSVRGIVAGCMKCGYWGCDLRSEQVDANNKQSAMIRPEVAPTWHCGDAEAMLKTAPQADLVFSCPPYGNLEVYSENKDDLSNMDYPKFMEKYFHIIQECYKKLKPNRFACFVVGDYRDKDGYYRNFVGETAGLFQAAGFHYYNEAILVNVVGTAAIRATRQFNGGRKLVKTHQNVLVFIKGDAKLATLAITKSDKEGKDETTTIRDSQTGDGGEDKTHGTIPDEIVQQDNLPAFGIAEAD